MAVATPPRAAPTPADRLITANRDEQQVARELDDLLVSVDRAEVALAVRGRNVTLPRPVFAALAQLVHQIALGHAVSLVPRPLRLTPQQAADLLDISRPHLMKLVRQGSFDVTKVGAHHRLDLEQVLEYRRERDAAFDATMDEMSADAQNAGHYA